MILPAKLAVVVQERVHDAQTVIIHPGIDLFAVPVQALVEGEEAQWVLEGEAARPSASRR